MPAISLSDVNNVVSMIALRLRVIRVRYFVVITCALAMFEEQVLYPGIVLCVCVSAQN